jgi:hypothetical protein
MAAVTPGFLEQPGTLRILDPLPIDLVRIDLHVVIAVHLDLSLRFPRWFRGVWFETRANGRQGAS